MPYDLRDYIADLERLGEMRRVRAEVDEDLELGHIAKLNEMRGGPALLFEQVRGRRGAVLTSMFSMDRLGVALGLAQGAGQRAICEHWMAGVGRAVAPMEVESGPVLEQSYRGGRVDLESLAIPRWYPNDGGRYLTYPCVVLRHPESGWVNVGIYRIMVHDRRTLGIQVLPGKHGRQILDAWHARGEPAPVAVFLGGDPMLLAYAGSGVAAPGECEYDRLGGLRGKPLEMVNAPVTGLPVPADAELLVEGRIPPGVLREEGPFGEFPGYYTPASPKEVIEVEAVHHRPDFILPGTTGGKPVSDNHVLSLANNTVAAWRALRDAGVKGLNAVACPEGCGGLFITVVSMRPQYPGHALEVGRMTRSKLVIVVDEDVDPFNLEEVLWAVNYRYQPDRGTSISYEPRWTPLDPSVDQVRRGTSSKIVIDATRPQNWPGGFPKEVKTDPKTVARVQKRWPELFGEPFEKK